MHGTHRKAQPAFRTLRLRRLTEEPGRLRRCL